MDQLDERIERAFKGRSKTSKEAAYMIREALAGSKHLEHDTLFAVVACLN
jgi:hypothetical protein